MNWRELTPKTARRGVVEFEDMVMFDNWNEESDPGTIECVASGWVIDTNAKHVMVASVYNYADDTWATIHVIPAGSVNRVVYDDGND